MPNQIQTIIQRIGETDQQFLQGNSPELAFDRADLRLQLVNMSKHRQEKIHFLQEAIVLLEQGRIEFEEMPISLYINLSLHLAKAYMMYFEITQESRFALITQQIMKPMAKEQNGEIHFFLAYASASKDEPALTRHWLGKYTQSNEFDFELVHSHSAFQKYHGEDWFKQLLNQKKH